MELQHTHTFRVTMTRSHRSHSSHAHASIKSNTNIFDANLAVTSELNTKRDACSRIKKHTSAKTYSTPDTHVLNRLDDTKSAAAKLMDNNHWQLNDEEESADCKSESIKLWWRLSTWKTMKERVWLHLTHHFDLGPSTSKWEGLKINSSSVHLFYRSPFPLFSIIHTFLPFLLSLFNRGWGFICCYWSSSAQMSSPQSSDSLLLFLLVSSRHRAFFLKGQFTNQHA